PKAPSPCTFASGKVRQCAVKPEASSSIVSGTSTGLAVASSQVIGSGLRTRQHLVHARNRDDVEAALDAVVNLDKILGVLLRNKHGLDTAAVRGKQLLLQAADRQNATPQRDFPGHRHVAMHRNAGH